MSLPLALASARLTDSRSDPQAGRSQRATLCTSSPGSRQVAAGRHNPAPHRAANARSVLRRAQWVLRLNRCDPVDDAAQRAANNVRPASR
jgi:hypothetical protein